MCLTFFGAFLFFFSLFSKKNYVYIFSCHDILEMDVLRQKLTEREEARGQLERQVTELSATVSSTLASYTFLEQALAAETTKYAPYYNTNLLFLF